ncbi:hypothetical protein C1H76_4191 [Elsinoe australis]|uniref:Uncharacterized protein n=1 Tax=Elsinoe australis TaxID=40998 RepID=A0A4U7B4I9_9PEZI|nr:hypothetical protein C1H76_4191 [Elsinoe australis]
MASTDQEHNLTEKEWKEYQRLKKEKQEWEEKDKEHYNAIAQKETKLFDLQSTLTKKTAKITQLENEKLGLESQNNLQEEQIKKDADLKAKIDKLNETIRSKDKDYAAIRAELQKLELENRTRIDELQEAQSKADNAEFALEDALNDLELAHEERKIAFAQAQDAEATRSRLHELQNLLQEPSICGRRLSKDIGECSVREIFEAVREAIHNEDVEEDGRESPESFQGKINSKKLRPPLQGRGASLNVELEGKEDDNDSVNGDSSTAGSIASGTRSQRNSVHSPQQSPRPDTPKSPRPSVPKSPHLNGSKSPRPVAAKSPLAEEAKPTPTDKPTDGQEDTNEATSQVEERPKLSLPTIKKPSTLQSIEPISPKTMSTVKKASTLHSIEPNSPTTMSTIKGALTLQSIEPNSPEAVSVDPITIYKDKLVAVDYSTTELLQRLPLWLWALLLIGAIILVQLFFWERETWLDANEITHQALIQVREQSRRWMPHLPHQMVFSTENLLGVQHGLRG